MRPWFPDTSIHVMHAKIKPFILALPTYSLHKKKVNLKLDVIYFNTTNQDTFNTRLVIFDFLYYPRIFSRVNLNLLSWKERLISVLGLSKFWSGYHQFNSFESISKDIGQTQFKVQILFQMPSQNSLKFKFKLNFIDQIKIQILLL